LTACYYGRLGRHGNRRVGRLGETRRPLHRWRVAFLFAWCRLGLRVTRLGHFDEAALYSFNGTNWVVAGPQLGQYIDLAEISPPSSPGADEGRLYAKDVAGVTKLAFRDHAGTETVLGSGSGGSSAGHSLLHNPDFRIATRGTSFTSAGNFPNNDGAYLLDGACCSRTATTSPMSIKSSPPFLSAPTQRPRSRWRPRTRNSASCFPSKRETPDRLSAAQPRCRSKHARAVATRRSARCAQRSYPGRGPRM